MLSVIRSAWRAAAAAPRVSLVAILSIALGVWGTTAIFIVVNGIVYRPLPVGDPGGLVRVGSTQRGGGFMSFSYPDYVTLRDRTRTLDGLVAHQPIEVSWRSPLNGAQARMGWAEIVSGNYFEVLRVPMRLGRGFAAGEDTSGGPPAVVVGERLWRTQLDADPAAVGRPLHINGQAFTLVGVTSGSFSGTFAGFDMQMWVPLGAQAFAMPHTNDRLDRRDAAFLMLIGRLRSGETIASVRREVRPLAGELAALDPPSHRGFGIAVAPASGVHPFIQSLLPQFLALLGAAVFVLLAVACANVAGLLLARAVERRREMATRAALGASRARLARQMLGESALLAGLGGALGLAASFWTVSLLRGWRPASSVPLVLPVSMDLRVALFACAITLLTALLFGAAPALQGSRFDLTPALKLDVTAASRQRLRRLLVSVQLVLAMTLLVPSVLLLRSVWGAAAVRVGVDPANVYTIALEPRLAGLDETRSRAYFARLRQAIAEIPGVRGTAIALFVPLGDRGDEVPIRIGTAPAAPPNSTAYNLLTAGYLELLGVPLLQGRAFTDNDTAASTPVVIVNAAFAEAHWPGRSPIGQTVRVRDEARVREVIGVVADGKYGNYAEARRPFVYLPYTQIYRPDVVLHVKLAAPDSPALEAVARTLRQVNPDVPAVGPEPMTKGMSWALVPVRIAAFVLGIASALAFALALIGLYALLSYGVLQRRREIGIRVALGATARDIRRLVSRDVRRLTAIAATVGLALALTAARLMRALLVGVGPMDPVATGGAVVVLVAIVWIALRAPTRRALSIDPAVALRTD